MATHDLHRVPMTSLQFCEATSSPYTGACRDAWCHFLYLKKMAGSRFLSRLRFPHQVLVEPVLLHLGTDPSPLVRDDNLVWTN